MDGGHMNRTESISRVTARCILLAGITGLGLSVSCWAAQPYLDDANQEVANLAALAVDGTPTTQQHGYPRFYAHENFGGLSAQALSRYQFIVVHGIHLDTVGAISGFAPDDHGVAPYLRACLPGFYANGPLPHRHGRGVRRHRSREPGRARGERLRHLRRALALQSGITAHGTRDNRRADPASRERRQIRGRPICRDLRRACRIL